MRRAARKPAIQFIALCICLPAALSAAGPLSGCNSGLPAPATSYCSKDDPRCPTGFFCQNGFCLPEAAFDASVAAEAGTPDLTSTCGNGRLDKGEQCDDTNLGGKTCQDLCYGDGKLTCLKSCTFSTESCTAPSAMVLIKAGKKSFYMGSLETEIGREYNEDRHKVTLTRNFLIAPTEVTQEQFTVELGYNPSYQPVKGHPVEEVLWHEAAAYCNALSAKKGLDKCYVEDRYSCPSTWMCKAPTEAVCKKVRCTWLKVNPTYNTAAKTIYDCPGYRLPTEAEWEFAYRADTTTATYAGDISVPGGKDPVAEKIGWYYKNSSLGAAHHAVAKKMPNAFCLFDMAGNVMEYTNDYGQNLLGNYSLVDPVGPSSASIRALRGGSFGKVARNLRGARREMFLTSISNINIGFRCVRTAL